MKEIELSWFGNVRYMPANDLVTSCDSGKNLYICNPKWYDHPCSSQSGKGIICCLMFFVGLNKLGQIYKR